VVVVVVMVGAAVAAAVHTHSAQVRPGKVIVKSIIAFILCFFRFLTIFTWRTPASVNQPFK
jgi:hypothetical protein